MQVTKVKHMSLTHAVPEQERHQISEISPITPRERLSEAAKLQSLTHTKEVFTTRKDGEHKTTQRELPGRKRSHKGPPQKTYEATKATGKKRNQQRQTKTKETGEEK
jgi:hypothetical protein